MKNQNNGPNSQQCVVPNNLNIANLANLFSKSQGAFSQEKGNVMTEIDLLEHSPFNFYHGINP